MPEGDTIHRTATTLRRALAGQTVTGFETGLAAVAAVDRRTPVAGRFVHAVESVGKHLLVVLRAPGGGDGKLWLAAAGLSLQRSDLILHTHMGMHGSWHLYRSGEPWRNAARRARVVLRTPHVVVPCFSAAVVELLTADEAVRHRWLGSLGPDLTRDTFDGADALARLRSRPEVEIGVALLDQYGLAGLGNVYKSEVLFVCRISPFTRVSDLPDEALAGAIEEGRRQLRANLDGGLRRTRFVLNPRERHWVYGRSGKPCRVCGEAIKMLRLGPLARSTYFCPRCQAVGEKTADAPATSL